MAYQGTSIKALKIPEKRFLSTHVKKNDPRSNEEILRDAGLRARIATVEDFPAVMDFLYQYFLKDEPLCAQVKLITSGHGTKCKSFDQDCFDLLKDDLTVVCESSDESVKGLFALSMSGITHRSKDISIAERMASTPLPLLPPLPPTTDPEERAIPIIRVIDTVMANSNVFGRYPHLDRLLDGKFLSVHPKYRGKRVGTALLDMRRELAVKKGLQLLRSTPTSLYSAAALKKLGYTCIYEFPFSKLLDSEGNRIFHQQPPHPDGVPVYVLYLGHKESST